MHKEREGVPMGATATVGSAVELDVVISVEDVVKDYQRGTQTVRALKGVSFAIHRGEFVSVLGPSGSGKSTLLHLMGALDQPTTGVVRIDGVDVGHLSDDELTDFRRQRLGFVFQFFNLLPTLSAWENVAVPLLLDGHRLKSLRSRAVPLLEALGLADRIDHRPAELSGGEMQRVAIARALVTEPLLVLADEPTGNLDTATGSEVLDVLQRICNERGAAVVMVTHDENAAALADRSVHLVDGRLVQ